MEEVSIKKPAVRKKTKRMRKDAASAKGETHSSHGKRPIGRNEHETPSRHLSREERSESEDDIFYDAFDYHSTALAPSVGHIDSSDKGCQNGRGETEYRVVELGQDPKKRVPYFPRHYARERYSVGVQTLPRENKPGDMQKLSSWGRGSAGISSSCEDLSSDEEYEDARESWSGREDTTLEQKRGGRQMRSRLKHSRGKKLHAQALCPKETSRRRSGWELSAKKNLGQQSSVNQSQKGRRKKTSCCGCLQAVLYWLAVMLFMSFLLSLFLTIFLLFSRNHGVGIGPTFIYTDVDLIRNNVNPYLDLRHNRAPPT